MPRKLLLINPKSDVDVSTPGKAIPPLAFGYIAALTPDDWDVEVIDENIDELNLKDADLVGITAMTITANRAYQIAGMYRDKGIKVVMGGIHASMLPEEALRFSDSVVIGEAEPVWPEVIRDFESGALKRAYQGEFLPLESFPLPRRDIFKHRYLAQPVQTTRGCPMRCRFCSVTAFNGQRYRMRPVEHVLKELESFPDKYVFFLDDNMVGHSEASRNRALDLFKGMIKRKLSKIWLTQVSINFAQDDELLHYAAKSGCRVVLIGFESVSERTLRGMNKNMNLRYGVESYYEAVRNLHKHGIGVNGQIIIGNDEDDLETISRSIDFMDRAKIDIPNIALLVPYPGTQLFDDLNGEGRLTHTNFPEDWKRYSGLKLVFKPGNLSPEQLRRGFMRIKKGLFSFFAQLQKIFRALKYTRELFFAVVVWRFNDSINRSFLDRVSREGL